jgi:6-phosphofructokinase
LTDLSFNLTTGKEFLPSGILQKTDTSGNSLSLIHGTYKKKASVLATALSEIRKVCQESHQSQEINHFLLQGGDGSQSTPLNIQVEMFNLLTYN